MFAEQFYTTDTTDAVVLTFLSPDDLQSWFKDAAEAEKNMLLHQKFEGKTGHTALVFDPTGVLQKVYLGVEKEAYGQALACAARVCPVGVYRLQSRLPESDLICWALEQYKFVKYKQSVCKPRQLHLRSDDFEALTAMVNAIALVRDLINTPANDMNPKTLAAEVEKLASQAGAHFQQWEGEALLKDNFPAIHAVGRAASDQPRLLFLEWGNPEFPSIALLGKGVCFDSGGLDIKSSSGMRLMKKDMGGAAHALALAQWIIARQLKVHLQLYIPAVENAVSGNAFRPGDVLCMRNGLTVEVDNTDAEGRLVLADALVKACETNPALVVDFATLTGAARVALGTKIATMFSNNDTLANDIMKYAAISADPVWQLPLFEPYEKMLSSDIADLSNADDSPYAGAITAALFLKHFVKKSTPWVHFDIMAWNVASEPGKPKGGEAMAIRAVASYLEAQYGRAD